jgi:Tfp pilus assembly protein PilN
MKYQAVITKLNLSSKPFRNRNLPYLLAFLLLVGAALGSALCFAQLQRNSQANERVVSHNHEMEAEIKRLNGEGEKVQQQLSPDQQALLIGAHKLVANKTFSWSRLFSDLESVLPGGVSASRISISNIYTDGERTKAELELGVLSHDYQAVITMIDSMNQSGHFQAELKGQDLQKNERVNFTEYTLHLIYIPDGYSESPAGYIAQTGGAK